MENLQQTQRYTCPEPGCFKSFDTVPGLRMHKIRKHSDKNWDTTGNFGDRKKPLRQERLKLKREHSSRLRESYYKAGLDSHGKKRGSDYHPRNKTALQVRGLPKATGQKWTAAQHTKFRATMRRRRLRRQVEPFVLRKEDVTQTARSGSVKFCPYCGHNIENLITQ
jgi:hypothetical protein